jgi:hypothetical protein
VERDGARDEGRVVAREGAREGARVVGAVAREETPDAA